MEQKKKKKKKKQQQPPFMKMKVKGKGNKQRVAFKYTGPYPIGVTWLIVKNGITTYTDATINPGETTTFRSSEGISHVHCSWGYGPALKTNLYQEEAVNA